MKKVLVAAVAPLMALPIAMASPASAAPHNEDRGRGLSCDVKAWAVGDDKIHVSVEVERDGRRENGRAFVRLTDNRRLIDQGAVRLPFRDSGRIDNLRGPDFIRLTAFDLRTGKSCEDSTVVWRDGRSRR